MVATDGRPLLAQPAIDQLQSAACELVLGRVLPAPPYKSAIQPTRLFKDYCCDSSEDFRTRRVFVAAEWELLLLARVRSDSTRRLSPYSN